MMNGVKSFLRIKEKIWFFESAFSCLSLSATSTIASIVLCLTKNHIV